MARTVHFRVDAPGLQALVDELRDRGAVIIPSVSPTAHDARLVPESLDVPCEGYLTLMDHVRRIAFDRTPGGEFYLRGIVSPVVHVVMFAMREDGRAKGFLQFNRGRFEAGEWVDHPSDFIAWADGILKWVRRNGKRSSDGVYDLVG